jgi:hypothetical protein
MTHPSRNRGENNPSYKGDSAGYGAIHAWVRRRKIKPEFCEKCGIVPPRELQQNGAGNLNLRDGVKLTIISTRMENWL